jgi:16S rRNA (cytidine1402-2'-O)-methyltransferase
MSEGKLLLIGTPIGNLGDMSARALEAIRSCSLLLCEDTRHTRKLLNHFGISTKVESFHEHNEAEKADAVLNRIAFGDVVGLVSDAGMPLLSDPGFELVRRARARRLTVEPIAGPFAAALALVASGLPPLPFAFFGFAPHRQGERLEFYRRIRATNMTAVVYESPQRVVSSLGDALEILGDVEASVARELTKLHEEVLNGRLSSVLEDLGAREQIRGEITLVLAAPEAARVTATPGEVAAEFRRLRDDGIRRTDAVKLLSERYGMGRSELYQMLLRMEEPASE